MPRRAGYTLLEMLLAVAVMVVLASLAAQPLMGTWRDNRLSEAAEAVRVTAAGARIQALNTDRVWQFRYEPGGTHYVRVPLPDPGDAEATSESSGGVLGRLSGTLPEGAQFVADAGSISTETLPPDLLSGLPDSGELMGVNWSAPILFFPDGTATRATFQIIDSRAGTREISVRDLTGTVSVRRPSKE